MKYLIVLNRKFPYKYGEAFMENEIDEISPFFDKILIFPSDMTPQDPVTRTIRSSNVEAIPFQHGSLKSRQLGDMAGGLFCPKDAGAGSLRNRLYSGYFESAARHQARRIGKILEGYHFTPDDQVVLYSYWFFINARAAVLLKKQLEKITNVRCISRAHAFDIYEEKKYLPQREALLQEMDAVFPCSDHGTAYIRQRYPAYRDKIHAAYLGTYDKGVLPRRPSEVFRILSCSRIAPEKRLELMIDSLACLRGSGLKLEWTHFGGGADLERIQALAKEKLDFMQTNFTGSIPNQQVYANYFEHTYDLFLNSSSAEGLPVSIMEAISFGVPVVATSAGGTGEIAITGVSGYLEPVDVTPEKFAGDIRAVATMDAEAYAALSTSARALWERKFQAPVNYRRFVEAIDALFEQKAEGK